MPKITNIVSTFKKRGFYALIRASLFATYGFISKALGKKFLKVNIYNYKMFVDLEDKGISRTLLLFGERELEHKRMLENFVKPGMTILDLGANIGYYALMELNLIGSSGKLIAVEPSKKNVNLLMRNLDLNGFNNIEIHNLAISDKVGEKKFFLSRMSNLNTFHDNGTGQLHLSGEHIDTKTTTVPALMGGRDLDLIRMDVEGHEVEVINGLLPSIKSGVLKPSIIFETHLSRYTPDHDFEPTLRNLFRLGYKVTLAGSSSKAGTAIIENKGYLGHENISSDGEMRMLFENISEQDTIDLVCREGGIRTILMAPNKE